MMASHSSNGGKWIRKEKRWAIYLRDGRACIYCLADLSKGQDGRDMTLDNVDENGGNHETNLVTSCRACNIAKAGSPVSAFASEDALARITKAIQTPLDISAAKTWLQQRAMTSGGVIKGPAGMPVFRANGTQTAAAGRITDKKLHDLAMQGIVPKPTAEGYDVMATLGAIIDWRKQAAPAADLSEFKRIQAQAEAQTAQRRNAREEGELIPTAVAILLMKPMMGAIKKKIRASDMPPGDRDELLSELAGLGEEINWVKEAKNAAKRLR